MNIINHNEKIISYNSKILYNEATVIQVIQSGLVLHLDASNSNSYSGAGSIWYDLSTKGNHCTLTNSPTYSSTDGGTIEFNGSNNYGTITNNSSLNFGTGDFTILVAMRHPLGVVGGNNAGCVIYKGSRFDAPKKGYLFASHAGTYSYHTLSDGSSLVEHLVQPNLISFSELRVVGYMRRNGNVYQINNGAIVYDNGIYSNNIDSTVDLNIAFNGFYNSYWAGSINNILMYNQALTEPEIYNNYLIQTS